MNCIIYTTEIRTISLMLIIQSLRCYFRSIYYTAICTFKYRRPNDCTIMYLESYSVYLDSTLLYV